MKKLLVALIIICSGLFLFKPVSASTISASDIVWDNGNLLTSSEISKIVEKSNKMYKSNEFYVHVYTETSTNSFNSSYAIAKSDEMMIELYNSLYVDAIIIFLGVSSSTTYNANAIEISCYGNVDRYISSTSAYNVTGGSALEYLQSEEWYDAIDTMIDSLNTKIFLMKLMPHGVILLIALGASIAFAFSLAKNNGSRVTVSHRTYLKEGTAGLLGHYDRYVRTTVTRTPRSTSSSGGGRSGGGGRSSGGGRSF